MRAWLVVVMLVGCADRGTSLKVAFGGAVASATGVGLLKSFEGDDEVPPNLVAISALMLFGGALVAVVWGTDAALTPDPPESPPPPEAPRHPGRAQAWALTKEAAAAARHEDCASVRAADTTVRDLDAELHAVVFERDVAIARCLGRL